MGMNRITCALLGHDYQESLYFYNRGPDNPPGNQRFRECRRCGHIPNERIAELLEDDDQ